MEKDQIPTFRETYSDEPVPPYKYIVIATYIGVILIFTVWVLMYIPKIWNIFNASSAYNFTGAFSNFVTPFIALIAATLTFGAFWAQYQSNLKQTKQFKQQDCDTKIERFESKFYEMLRIHIQNVEFMDIQSGKIQKRKVFTAMYYELRFIYYILEKEYCIQKEIKTITEEEKKTLTNVAYIIFFLGIGYNSDQLRDELLDKYADKEYYNRTSKILNEYCNEYSKKTSIARNCDGLYISGNKTTYTIKNDVAIFSNIEGKEIAFRLVYKPFNGHQSRLSHYFRNLFGLVRFVDSYNDEVVLMSLSQKRKYLKILRQQLSTFEQLLLYYNCQSIFGVFWEKFEFIQNYRLIKNIPLPYANFGVNPEIHYADAIRKAEKEIAENSEDREPFFEWYELKDHLKDFNLQ